MKFLNTNQNQNPIQLQFAFPATSNRYTNILSLLALLAVVSLLFPLLVHSQELNPQTPVKATSSSSILYLDISKELYNSSTFTVDLNVDPQGQSINAVGVSLNFASSSIQATNINTDNSFCNFFIDSSIHQETNEITVFCGKPYPGINDKANIAQITFKKISSGWTDIDINPNSQVLANDGFGTNVLEEINNQTIFID